MASLADIQNQIIELYIGTFNRAPDAEGLAYWVDHIVEDGWTVLEVAQSMFDSQEVADTYPSSEPDSAFVEQVYQNVLARSADEAGLAYWVSELANGLSREQMITSIINGAKASSGSATDAALLEHKTEVARYFTLTLGYNDLTLAESALANVGSTQSSRDEALDALSLYRDSLDAGRNVVQGTSSADTLNGSDGADYIYAQGGDDTVNAGNGNNVIYGGLGMDNIYSGNGNDTIYARAGDDTVYSGGGNDIVYGNEGADSLHLEAGNDIAYGGDGDDFIYGYEGNNLIKGEEGNDTIFGGSGSNMIYGGVGNDIIYTGDGGNFVEAGEGNDTVYGGSSVDRIYGGDGDDIIYGFAGNDVLEGHTGNDILYGGAGDDQMTGSEGRDTLVGGAGNDTLNGEEDDDVLTGGAGADLLTGGTGNDRFIFNSGDSTLTDLDTISDFEFSVNGLDKIELVNQGDILINDQRLNVDAATSLQQCADWAAASDASINAVVSWFNYDENTYIVQDLSASTTFDETTDIIIKLQGIQDLSGIDTDTLVFS
jgi:hypothetical protein